MRTSAFSRGREVALRGARVLAEQRLGDHEAEHAVAEELEALVMGAAAHRRMRQRLDQQLGPGEVVAETGARLPPGPG